MTAGHVCSVCDKFKPLERYNFYHSKGYWYRRKSCRDCGNAEAKARHHRRKDDATYLERKRASERRTYAKNRDKRRASSDRWYFANHERNKKRMRLRRRRNVPRKQ